MWPNTRTAQSFIKTLKNPNNTKTLTRKTQKLKSQKKRNEKPLEKKKLGKIQIEKRTNDVNVRETGEGEGLEKLAANSASANHKHLGILKIFQTDIRGGKLTEKKGLCCIVLCVLLEFCFEFDFRRVLL